jgi:hypothetical protein
VRTDENDLPNVKFDRPLDIRVMTIDGTRSGEGRLIEISDSDAVIELTSHAVDHAEFFLLLTGFGNPVFRRCTRKWIQGAQTGVTFDTANIGIKSAKEAPEEQSGLSKFDWHS